MMPIMTFAQARKTDAEFISVIDITPLRDGRNPQRVADQLHQASRGLGFIYIKVHGIPAGIIGAAREAAFAFFRAPVESRKTVAVLPKYCGWLGRRLERVAAFEVEDSRIA